MIKEFFKIGGVKNEKEFLAKYPTEASFFRQHPEAMSMLQNYMPYTPSYGDIVMPQAMYGMGMAYGGYVPRAANGMQVTTPPRQEDYPDYESYSQAMDEYLGSIQQQADTSQTMPQGATSMGLMANNLSSLAAQQAEAMLEAGQYRPQAGLSRLGTNAMAEAALEAGQAASKLKKFKGSAIVDFLMAQGMPSDFASRKQLASSLGITNYRGTATQNRQMIDLLQRNPNAIRDTMAQPGFKQGGSWNGTWNGNQGFQVGGSYIPDYASSAYGLPQFEMGAPIYANGGMSPEEAMMMQQQGAPQAPPQQGGGMDQEQVVQAIMQMMQQGLPPDQIMQQLVQGGIPPQMAQQLVQMVMMQLEGGQGGGQPNGMQQQMAPPSPEQGMEGMQMPGGMARGGIAPGWEGEVTMDQLEELRKKGIKFDII